MRFKNSSKERIAYRDDSGKHFVDAGNDFELVGDQHAPAVLAIPGVVFVEGAYDPTPERAPEEAAKAEAAAEVERKAKVTPV